MKARLKKACFIGAALLILGCAYLLFYMKTGFGIPCVFNLVTGLQCPGCGTTRMLASLAKLDFKAAWHYNPVVLLMLPFIGYIVIKDVVCRIKYGKTKSSKLENYTEIAMIAVLIIFGIARNIV